MSRTRFILTADDYGPVDFINNGIIHHVALGTINSVQVLANFDQDLLNKNMDLLWKAVPEGKTVDVGIHLTLASGTPLTKERDGMDTPTIWDKFVTCLKYTNRDGVEVDEYVFTKYSDFYLEYELKRNKKKKPIIDLTIIQEFQAQKAQLETALSFVAGKNPDKPNALKLTSVSNHYDFFTLSENLFTLYRNVAPDLAIRSPRRIPLKKSKAYVSGLAALFLGTIPQRVKARKNIELFDKYEYSETVEVKTSGYIDIGVYASLGGLSESPVFTGMDSRFQRLEEAMDRSKSHATWKEHPGSNKIVEIVFHLGSTPARDPNFSIKDEQGYVGINYKYFSNRLIETRMLNAMSQEKEFQDLVLSNLTTWDNCPKITFTEK